MVAQIKMVKSLMNVLSYNEKKVREAKAKVLFAAGFPRGIDDLTYNSKMTFFRKLADQNLASKAKIVHLTLNFHPKDNLDKRLLIQIAHDYMKGIGLGGQPYLVYQHYDAGHPHIHIASVRIANGGERIDVYDKGFIQAYAVSNQIERTYGLIRIQDQMNTKSAEVLPKQAVKLERVQYGSVQTGNAIISIVSEVVKSYKFSSLTDLNEILNQFGVIAYTGVPGGKMRASGGVVYWLLKENNKKIGVAIRPRYIEGKPTLENLEKRYKQNKISRRPLGQRLKNLLDKSLITTKSQEEMARFLKGYGMRVVFRKDSQGKLTGVTYIDNSTRIAYNGLDLGQKYHAQTFWQAIENKAVLRPVGLSKGGANHSANHNAMQPHHNPSLTNNQQSISQESTPPAKFIPAQDLPVIQVLADKFFFDHARESQKHLQQGLEKTGHKQKGMDLEI